MGISKQELASAINAASNLPDAWEQSRHTIPIAEKLFNYFSRNRQSDANSLKSNKEFLEHFIFLLVKSFGEFEEQIETELQKEDSEKKTFLDSFLKNVDLTSSEHIPFAIVRANTVKQAFENLLKPVVDFKRTLTTQGHIILKDVVDHKGENCFHRLARQKGEKEEDLKEKIKILIDKGVDLNHKDVNGINPMRLAIFVGNFEMVEQIILQETYDTKSFVDGQNILHALLKSYDTKDPKPKVLQIIIDLLDKNEDFLARDKDGNSPLKLMVQKQMNAPLKKVFKKHANTFKDEDWMDVLVNTAKNGFLSILNKVLEYEEAIKIINQDMDGMSLVQHAVESNNEDVLRALKDKGADFTITDSAGNNLLHLAASKPQAFKYLLKKTDLKLNAKNNEESDVYECVARSGSSEVVNVLLEDESEKSSFSKIFKTALCSGNKSVLKHLLEGKSKIEVSGSKNSKEVPIYEKHNYEFTAKNTIHQAVVAIQKLSGKAKAPQKKAVLETLDVFLNFCKQNPAYRKILDVTAEDGETALYSAVQLKDIDLLKILIRNGADVNKPDLIGTRPVMLAIEEHSSEILEELFKSKSIDFSLKDGSDKNILHYAAESSIEILKSVWGKVISGKDSSTMILLDQSKMSENFLHLFLLREDIESSIKIEFLNHIWKIITDDRYKEVFEQETKKSASLRSLILSNDELKEEFGDKLPDFVPAAGTIERQKFDIPKKSQTEKDISTNHSIDIIEVLKEIKQNREEIESIRSELSDFRKYFVSELSNFQSDILASLTDLLKSEYKADSEFKSSPTQIMGDLKDFSSPEI